jgi:hypothetical protein
MPDRGRDHGCGRLHVCMYTCVQRSHTVTGYLFQRRILANNDLCLCHSESGPSEELCSNALSRPSATACSYIVFAYVPMYLWYFCFQCGTCACLSVPRMHVCTRVCVYATIHVRVLALFSVAHTHTVYVYVHVTVYYSVCMHIYVCMHVIFGCACMHASCMHAGWYRCMHVYICICMYLFMHVCMPLYVCICAFYAFYAWWVYSPRSGVRMFFIP